MIQLLTPQHLQPLIRREPDTRLAFPVALLGLIIRVFTFGHQIGSHFLGIDNLVLPGKGDGNIQVPNIFLPQDVVRPKEAPEQRVGHAHVCAGKVVEL